MMATFTPTAILSSNICMLVAPSHTPFTAAGQKKNLLSHSRAWAGPNTQTKLSKIEKIGQAIHAKLVHASQKSTAQQKEPTDAALLSVLVEVNGNYLARKVMHNYQDVSRAIEDILLLEE